MNSTVAAALLALIPFAGALLGSVIANLIAPSLADRRQRKAIDRQRKIESINAIYTWVAEHLTAATLPFFKASEEDKEWRAAVYRYEESDASLSHAMALARRLSNAKQIEAELRLLTTETEKMLKTFAWKKLHRTSEEKANESAGLKLESEFEEVKDKAINYASEIYNLLEEEAAQLLGLKGFLIFRRR